MEPATIPEIDQYELDGIPLFHLPMAGETILTLAFRVGRADEPLIQGGMTHLAEHLILTSISNALDHSNGTTEPYRVTFTRRGNPAEVTQFLKDVCRAIEMPPVNRMHEEARVLRTEASGRGGMGMSLRMAWYRTGYQGLGTFSLPEFFLRQMSEDVLRAWIAENLVAGNAVIWIAGEIPDDLLVDLAPGPRRPMPDVAWIPDLQTPTFVVDDGGAIGASFVMERSIASSTALRALERRLRHALRVDRGLAYDVASDHLPISQDLAIANVWASCLPESAAEVERILLESIDDIAARGPSETDIGDQHERLVRELADPVTIPGRLDGYARDVLLGRTPEPMADLVDDYWRLRPEEVASAFRKARETMLLLLPSDGFRPQRPMNPYPVSTKAPAGRGRTFEQVPTTKKPRFAKATPAARLTVGDQGVTVDAPNGRRIIGVRWADCVAVIQDPESRSVLARDGTVLAIYQDDWRSGGDAMGMVDRAAPRGIIIPAEH